MTTEHVERYAKKQPRREAEGSAGRLPAPQSPRAVRPARAGDGPAPAIARPGDNCWVVARADRFRCVQDGADYFRWIRHAVLQARHSIFVIGWDIQANLDLLAGEPAPDGAPTRLDALLAFVARRRPQLRCYVLIWDHAALYTLERDPLSRWRLGWRMPRQVRFGFDDYTPVGGSHHQKIVVVDDALAFCGGIDLTGHRWDTTAHRLEEPARTTAVGMAYGPYHEVQAMVRGPAAARLGTVARDRWRVLGDEPRPVADASAAGLWPADATPDLVDADVAIARTMPASARGAGSRECERLFLDSIAAARRAIYIESQYFTNDTLGAALAGRLREPDGPEVLLVVPMECQGWLERQTMGALREGVLRQLIAADQHGRLRVVYPAASRAAGIATFVHAKVMVVDDVLMRIGSANWSRRSMGVDTECDVAVDAGGNHEIRRGIRRMRDRLLGEHLGLSGEAVARELGQLGALRDLVDARRDADRTLVPVELAAEPVAPAAALQAAADPDEPIQVAAMAEWIPPLDAAADRGTVRLWLPAVAGAALIAAAGQAAGLERLRALLEFGPGLLAGPVIAVAALLVAHAALVPLELLAVAAGLFLGAPAGVLVALAGGWIAAAIGYAVGRWAGPARLSRWMTRRAYRSARQLGAHGVGGVAILRLASLASAGSGHVLCGAAGVPFGAYVVGSVIGLTPLVAALSGIGALVRLAILAPSWSRWLQVGGTVMAVAGLAAALRTALLLRQFSPAVSHHRQRAEFG